MFRKSILLFVIFVIAFAVGTFGATSVRAFWYSPDDDSAVPAAEKMSHDPQALPERLVIPSLSIDANVQDVGVNAKGNMATPDNFTDVGWYKYGPTPGGNGSAVIAGHVNNGLGLSGVFEHLADIKVGDAIYIDRADGVRAHFVVTGIKTYPYNDVPADVIFNPSGSPRLNLITCEGTWVKENKTYNQRLVVTAAPANE